jgi:hypothetical protein
MLKNSKMLVRPETFGPSTLNIFLRLLVHDLNNTLRYVQRNTRQYVPLQNYQLVTIFS